MTLNEFIQRSKWMEYTVSDCGGIHICSIGHKASGVDLSSFSASEIELILPILTPGLRKVALRDSTITSSFISKVCKMDFFCRCRQLLLSVPLGTVQVTLFKTHGEARFQWVYFAWG